MNFNRNIDPIRSLNIGIETLLDQYGVLILYEKDLITHHQDRKIKTLILDHFYIKRKLILEANIIVFISEKEKSFNILKNRYVSTFDFGIINPISKLNEFYSGIITLNKEL